jgi:hypothetical protein
VAEGVAQAQVQAAQVVAEVVRAQAVQDEAQD